MLKVLLGCLLAGALLVANAKASKDLRDKRSSSITLRSLALTLIAWVSACWCSAGCSSVSEILQKYTLVNCL